MASMWLLCQNLFIFKWWYQKLPDFSCESQLDFTETTPIFVNETIQINMTAARDRIAA